MKTVVINKQRVSKFSHEEIKKKAHEEMCRPNVVIRKILHEWALKQKGNENLER